MCTVMLRFSPGGRWPVVVAAVRDEFMGRAWDPPAAYWPEQPSVLGGRDRVAGGTWLAVDTAAGGVAAVLNGVPLADRAGGRPTRGRLPLAALAGEPGIVPGIPDEDALAGYDGFHLIRAERRRVEAWSWDGQRLSRSDLRPGDHIAVNLGPDRADDPLIPHFRPLLSAVADPGPLDAPASVDAWAGWIDLLRGDGLDPADERGLIIAHRRDGRAYGSTSASLVALGADGQVRYDFTGTPRTPDWAKVYP